MNWFLIALIAPALWSITNHLDKYLLSKYVKNSPPGALILFSSAIGIVVIPIAFFFAPNIFHIGLLNIFLMIASAFLYLFGLIPYLYALNDDEASIVIPIFQTVPIFGFIYAYFVLGETLTLKQILASLLIIGGAVAISLDLQERIPKFKKKLLFYMLFSSAVLAGGDLLFKFVALNDGFWTSLFWQYVGYVIFTILVLLFVRSYRNQFFDIIRKNKSTVFALNSLNEFLNITARIAFSFATLLAPLALVQVVNGFQPFFVFLYGVILTLLFPRFGVESLTKRHLIHKLVAIAVIFLGTYILQS